MGMAKTERLNQVWDAEDVAKLKEWAEREGRSVGDIIRRATMSLYVPPKPVRKPKGK